MNEKIKKYLFILLLFIINCGVLCWGFYSISRTNSLCSYRFETWQNTPKEYFYYSYSEEGSKVQKTTANRTQSYKVVYSSNVPFYAFNDYLVYLNENNNNTDFNVHIEWTQQAFTGSTEAWFNVVCHLCNKEILADVVNNSSASYYTRNWDESFDIPFEEDCFMTDWNDKFYIQSTDTRTGRKTIFVDYTISIHDDTLKTFVYRPFVSFFKSNDSVSDTLSYDYYMQAKKEFVSFEPYIQLNNIPLKSALNGDLDSIYNAGFDAGNQNQSKLTDVPESIINSTASMFKQFLNFDFLGVNVASLVGAIITVLIVGGLVIVIVKHSGGGN